MGFGRGKGFTTKVRTEMTKFVVRVGGGAARLILTELSPTYGIRYGGGAGRVTLTELNPTYETEVTVKDYEEQTQHDYDAWLYSGYVTREGQKLTIHNREVTKLGFWLTKEGNPTGNVTFVIRKVSDSSIINSKIWGDAADLPTEVTYEEVEFDTPVTINEEVRILCEFSGGDVPNYVIQRYQHSDVKANEVRTYWFASAWNDRDIYDGTYRYTFT